MKTKAFIMVMLFTVILMGSLCAEDVMFNYQGRVKVQGTLFSGTGYFKFAIVNNAGNETMWSNDGTSTGGGEPTDSISIAVTDGIFNVLVGDTSLGMDPINRMIFNHPEKIKLRIWFSDGTLGFQQLLPDHHLTNVDLLGMTTGTVDFTIYVNGTTGNDNHNGLTPAKAKKTIQAAVDVLPERINCNVTIDIADGVYRERVNIYGITVHPEKNLLLLGDESWTPGSGDPAVRISGNDDDVSGKRVRQYAVCARDCSRVQFKGIMFDGGSYTGLGMYEGSYGVLNCKAKDNVTGIAVGESCMTVFSSSTSEENDDAGIYVSTNCRAVFTSCKALNNGGSGVTLNSMCIGTFLVSGEYSNNTGAGIHATHNSKLSFYGTYSGQIQSNSNYGIEVLYNSYCVGHTKNTFSGNTPGNVNTGTGGVTY